VRLLARDIEGFSEGEGRSGIVICRLRVFATMADLCHRVIRRCVTTTFTQSSTLQGCACQKGGETILRHMAGQQRKLLMILASFRLLGSHSFPMLTFSPQQSPAAKDFSFAEFLASSSHLLFAMTLRPPVSSKTDTRPTQVSQGPFV
jgi:hypothetical protein